MRAGWCVPEWTPAGSVSGTNSADARRLSSAQRRPRRASARADSCERVPGRARGGLRAARGSRTVAREADMALSDTKGLAVSTTSTDALTAYERGVDLFLRWRGGAMEALDAAAQHDPSFALVHCTRAWLAARMGRADLATAAADRAAAVADSARTERERAHVDAVAAMRRADTPRAYAALGRISAADPTDRVAVRIVGLNCITQGDYRGGIDIARRSLAADPGEPQFETMLGFFLEQSGYNDEGLEWSSRSLARDPTNLYTYHAVGHAYQARGDYPRAVETFSRATSLERYAHLLWHLAEAQAILGHERLTRDYWGAPSPGLPLYERIELLWRLEFLRGASTDDAVWRDLAAQADRVLEHADFQTTWMHHWIGLRSEEHTSELQSLRH